MRPTRDATMKFAALAERGIRWMCLLQAAALIVFLLMEVVDSSTSQQSHSTVENTGAALGLIEDFFLLIAFTIFLAMALAFLLYAAGAAAMTGTLDVFNTTGFLNPFGGAAQITAHASDGTAPADPYGLLLVLVPLLLAPFLFHRARNKKAMVLPMVFAVILIVVGHIAGDTRRLALPFPLTLLIQELEENLGPHGLLGPPSERVRGFKGMLFATLGSIPTVYAFYLGAYYLKSKAQRIIDEAEQDEKADTVADQPQQSPAKIKRESPGDSQNGDGTGPASTTGKGRAAAQNDADTGA